MALVLEFASDIIQYSLIRTERRLTFDNPYLANHLIYKGEDDGNYFKFTANNSYEIISRSRMDIQTERLWLLGASDDVRSGTMVFSSNKKRDEAFNQFVFALDQWHSFVLTLPEKWNNTWRDR